MITEQQAIAELLLNIEKQSNGDFMSKMSFLIDCWWIMDEVAVDIRETHNDTDTKLSRGNDK